ncbi:hypothetical protein ASD64_07090 [Mesorhizobium sp. Root157]|uniref:hypothetical protein n=1 Tax=Mesorhizobium sp. Root157 TaxID=1736477 RepID=UPI0006F2CC71|nr:hypothetical protein [Mesorhizobium sp. Root157]KQZ87200.1 hypothetical protein ASD64_07090 [Mesorhizobium sp. Root157]
MSVLTAIRSRLKDLVVAAHPDFRDVNLHYGRLEADEVRKISMFTPAARVGVFGPVRSEYLPTGELKIMPRFAAVAIAREGDLLESTDTAMDLAVALAATFAAWCPGAALVDGAGDITSPALLGVGLPEAISVEPSPARELEAEGIALWGCLFTVPVVIGVDLAKEEATGTVEISGLDDYFEVPEDAP